MTYLARKYDEFITENGYIPFIFNPWNLKEIIDISPTITSSCGSATSINGIALIEGEEEKRDILRKRDRKPLIKDINVYSMFSGAGAFEDALTRLGINVHLKAYCEIDKFASTSYSAIHDISETKNVGDAMKVDYGKVLFKDVELITGGSPCFKKGTFITTDKGLKKIEDIQRGDMVLTHKNRFREVVTPMVNYANHLYRLNIQGSPITYVTAEHPYYVREAKRVWNKEDKKYERIFSEAKWKEVKDLEKGDFIGIAINQKSKNRENITREEAWLIGRYIADGYIRNSKRSNRKNSYNNQVVFCVGKEKLEDFMKNIETYHVGVSEERTAYKCRLINKRFMDLCMRCKRGSSNKIIPDFIMDLPVDLLEIFLDGYMSGDGSYKDGLFRATSVSKKLIYQLGQIVTKVYQAPYSTYYTERPKTTVIEGRTVNQRDSWSISFRKEFKKQTHGIFDKGMVWLPFRKKELHEYDGDVYNFEVEEDNSYVANNCAVHNCQDFSVSGKKQGSMHYCNTCDHEFNPLLQHFSKRGICPECNSTDLEVTRSSLLIEYLRAVREVRPDYFIYENVKGLMYKNFKPGFDIFNTELQSYGYNTYYEVLNAKDHGVPQNRERVFVVGIKREIDKGNFVFPEGYDLGLRLRDFLDREVDEKYYIKDERVDKLLKEFTLKQLPFQDFAYCIDSNYHKGTNIKGFIEKRRRQLISEEVCIPCITPDRLKVRQEGRRFKTDGEPMFTVTAQDRHGVIVSKNIEIAKNNIIQINNPTHSSQRIYSKSGISPTISAGNRGGGKEPCKIIELFKEDINTDVIINDNESNKNNNLLKFVGGIGSKDWAGDGKQLSRNFSQGDRVYSEDGLAVTQSSNGGGVAGPTGMYLVRSPNEIQMVEIEQLVLVRKHEVDTEALVGLLREKKELSKLTNREIALRLGKPLTTVEHWFRTDSSFSIPDADIWFDLKEILEIEINKFDLPITEFVEQEGVYEKGNRYYLEEGIFPTLTTSSNEKVISAFPNELDVFARLTGGKWDKMRDENVRVYKETGICPTISTCQGGHREPKVMCNTNQYQMLYRVRKLTPLECFRLMGFTDEAYWLARKALEEKYYNGNDRSNSQMYKIAGNSIVVDVLMDIFENLFQLESSTGEVALPLVA